MRAKIESFISGKGRSNPLLGYSCPPSNVHIEKMTWILFSSQGFTTKKGAQDRIDEIDADPESSIGSPRVIVKWRPLNKQTSKYYVYYRWKRDET